MRLSLPPLALYIHIPWCEKKCPYCDFNSHVNAQFDEDQYIKTLIKDAKSQLDFVQGRELTSIFIGGGTPSLFSAEAYQQLFDQLRQLFTFSNNIEITLEANPSSSEQEKFAGFRQAGINRLSIGVQSFANYQLEKLGRIHKAEQAHSAINAAQQAGFERINIDLMHGLPKQSPAQALDDLQQAINTGVSHISWYQLTIEPNTEFFSRPPPIPEDDDLADIQEQGFALLKQYGFNQYEVSAFSKAGMQSQHNINYWQFGDYLAIGAGAHGKVSMLESGEIKRFNNTRLPKDYLNRIDHYRAQIHCIDEHDILFEALMNGLRLNQGIAIEDLLLRTHQEQKTLLDYIQPQIEKGLLCINNKHIACTEQGRPFLNTILENLLVSN